MNKQKKDSRHLSYAELVKQVAEKGNSIKSEQQPSMLGYTIFLNFVIVVLLVFICFIGGEYWARRSTDQPLGEHQPNERWVELLATLPEKEIFLSDHNKAVDRLKYHDYHLHSLKPYKSETINFTDFYSARYSPDSCDESMASETIWIFGGSTMQNLETTDKRTIANHVALFLKENGVCATIHNFGVTSFQSSLELIKFQNLLSRVPESKQPTMAIFYDGYNDAHYGYFFGAGNLQRDLANKLRLLVEKDYKNLLQYTLASALAKHSVLFRDYVFKHAMPLRMYDGHGKDSSEQNLKESVSIYLSNVRLIRAISQEFDIMPLFVLQPLITSKQGLTAFEKEFFDMIKSVQVDFVQAFYKKIIEQMDSKSDFVNLSSVLDNNEISDFYDYGHTGPFTGEVIGKAIGVEVLMRIKSKQGGVESERIITSIDSFENLLGRL